jgi:hypothetical protein
MDFDDVDPGAQGAQQLKALLGETVGHHDQTRIALCAADQRERRAGAASRVFDDGVAWREGAFTFGALDHR